MDQILQTAAGTTQSNLHESSGSFHCEMFLEKDVISELKIVAKWFSNGLL